MRQQPHEEWRGARDGSGALRQRTEEKPRVSRQFAVAALDAPNGSISLDVLERDYRPGCGAWALVVIAIAPFAAAESEDSATAWSAESTLMPQMDDWLTWSRAKA